MSEREVWEVGQHPAMSKGWIVRPVLFGSRAYALPAQEGGHIVLRRKEDATLIAAAPELLAALRDWLGFAEETLSEFDVEPCDAETLCPKCQPAGCINLKMQLARAAIAKATGEK